MSIAFAILILKFLFHKKKPEKKFLDFVVLLCFIDYAVTIVIIHITLFRVFMTKKFFVTGCPIFHIVQTLAYANIEIVQLFL